MRGRTMSKRARSVISRTGRAQERLRKEKAARKKRKDAAVLNNERDLNRLTRRSGL